MVAQKRKTKDRVAPKDGLGGEAGRTMRPPAPAKEDGPGCKAVRERFIDEAVEPVTDTCDTPSMAAGGPGLSRVFMWRGRAYEVASVLRSWRVTGRCSHGSPEMYVRKHFYEVLTTTGEVMKLYFDRQPRKGRKGPRWWLFSMKEHG